MAYKKKTKKAKRHVDSAVVHVQSTFNNTLVTVTTTGGDVLVTDSAGRMGFKGTRKGTPFAASQVGSAIAKHLLALGVKNLEINLKGPGAGRDSVVRSIQSAPEPGFDISVLRDVTPLAHNGSRPPKKRRV